MADRTSAGIFGKLFNLLAENPTDEHKGIAKQMFNEIGNYDFSEYQMYADESLIKLNLAHKGVDSKYPEDGEVIIYKPLP